MNSITNVLLFFLSVILLAMCFIAVNVYVKRLSLQDLHDMLTSISVKNTTQIAKSPAKKAESWSAIFAKKEIPHYRYPVSEMSIYLDFSNANHTDILRISNLDSYKFFCLKEILKSNNIQFTYKITNQKAMLEVALDSAKKRENLIADLKRYNIAYNITKG